MPPTTMAPPRHITIVVGRFELMVFIGSQHARSFTTWHEVLAYCGTMGLPRVFVTTTITRAMSYGRV